jgi:tetratricopeptide (TPR) repeat protein
MVSALDRLARDFWRLRFRIPRRALWLGLLVALVVLIFWQPGGEGTVLAAFFGCLALVGLIQWELARRRFRGSLVVPLFQEGGGATGFGKEAQALIVDDLRRHLPTALRDFVRAIPVVIGSDEDEFAAALQRRLGAGFVMHGRVAARPDGGWSIYPRILEPASNSTTHMDSFTRDLTPANPRFGPFVASLSPQIEVQDEEFPLEFCRDLEALIRGLVGLVAQSFGANERALSELDKALSIAKTSTNHQVDRLRIARAKALNGLDRRDEAIDSLRIRCRNPSPSPELLRTLSWFLVERANKRGDRREAKRDHKEAIKILRVAVEDEQDPQRDMSIHNLYALLDFEKDRREIDELLDHLMRSSSNYHRQWYIKRAVGLRAWLESEEARSRGEEQEMKRWSREAAKWYSRGVRARPLLQFRGLSKKPPFLRLKRFHRSPILHANAFDAHGRAGHRFRALWHERRFQRTRKWLMSKGDEYMRNSDWNAAFAYFDWGIVGRHDQREQFLQVYAACCLWKGGDRDEGERRWKEVHRETPNGVLARGMLVKELMRNGLDPAVPGSEPTDPDEVSEFIDQNPQLWSEEARRRFVENLAETIPGFQEPLVDAEIEKLIEEEDDERS